MAIVQGKRNLILTFSRQGRLREFCCDRGKYFDCINFYKKHVSFCKISKNSSLTLLGIYLKIFVMPDLLHSWPLKIEGLHDHTPRLSEKFTRLLTKLLKLFKKFPLCTSYTIDLVRHLLVFTYNREITQNVATFNFHIQITEHYLTHCRVRWKIQKIVRTMTIVFG